MTKKALELQMEKTRDTGPNNEVASSSKGIVQVPCDLIKSTKSRLVFILFVFCFDWNIRKMFEPNFNFYSGCSRTKNKIAVD